MTSSPGAVVDDQPPDPGGPAIAVTTEDYTLRRLLYQCAQRDESALASFYDLTCQRIYTLIRRRLDRHPEADEALIAVYLQVWLRSASFPAAERSALAWVTSIAFEGAAA